MAGESFLDSPSESITNSPIIKNISIEYLNRLILILKLLFKSEMVGVSVIGDDVEEFLVAAGIEKQRIPITQSYAQEILQTKDTVIIRNILLEERVSKNPLMKPCQDGCYYRGAPIFNSNKEISAVLWTVGKSKKELETELVDLFEYFAKVVEFDFKFNTSQASFPSNNLFRSLFEHHNTVGTCLFTDGGDFVIYNKSWMMQMHLDASSQRSWMEAILDIDRDQIKERWKQKIQNGNEFYLKFRIFNKIKKVCWCSLLICPICDPSNKLVSYLGTVLDVTEVDQFDKFSDHFFQQSIDLLCIMGPDGYLRRINSAWEKCLGFKESDIIEKPIIDMIHPEDQPRVWEKFKELLSTKKVEGLELRLRTKLGAYKWISWNAIVSEDDQLIYSASREITAQKISLVSLMTLYSISNFLIHSKSIVASGEVILKTICDGFKWQYGQLWLVDFENKELHLSSDFDAANAENQEMRSSQGFHVPLNDGVEILNRTLESLSVQWVEQISNAKELSSLRIPESLTFKSAIAFPIKNQDQVFGVIILFSKEIERRDSWIVHVLETVGNQIAEFILRRSSQNNAEFLASIVKSSESAIIGNDLDGSIISWNEKAAKVFHYKREEMVGQSSLLLFARSKQNEIKGLYSKVVQGESIENFETSCITKHHLFVDVALTLSPIRNSEEEITGFSIIANDISERKKLDKMKEEFISTVSHELRTPLTSIIGGLSLAVGKKSDEMSPQVLKLVDIAFRNSQKLSTLIADILDISKLETADFNFNITEFDLIKVLKSTIEMNYALSDKYRVKVIADFPPHEMIVKADPDRVGQIFTNLLSNAIKFSPEGGQVLISIENRNDRVKINFIDQGPGVPKELQTKIFGKFARIDSSDTRQRSGVGLGLHISKMLAEKMGGKIGLDPSREKGSLFFYELPIESS